MIYLQPLDPCVNPVVSKTEAAVLNCRIRIRRRTDIFSLNFFTVFKSRNIFASDKKTLFTCLNANYDTISDLSVSLTGRIKSRGM